MYSGIYNITNHSFYPTKIYKKGFKPVEIGDDADKKWVTKDFSRLTPESSRSHWVEQAWQNVRNLLPYQIKSKVPQQLTIYEEKEIRSVMPARTANVTGEIQSMIRRM